MTHRGPCQPLLFFDSVTLHKRNLKVGFLSKAQPKEGAFFVNELRGFAPKLNASTFSHYLFFPGTKKKVEDTVKRASSLWRRLTRLHTIPWLPALAGAAAALPCSTVCRAGNAIPRRPAKGTEKNGKEKRENVKAFNSVAIRLALTKTVATAKQMPRGFWRSTREIFQARECITSPRAGGCFSSLQSIKPAQGHPGDKTALNPHQHQGCSLLPVWEFTESLTPPLA